MTNLITLENITLAYGLEPLLDHVKLQISKGERVCLIGRNGAGKSSLLKIIEGSILPDSGTVWRQPHLRLARLAQDLPTDIALTVYDFVAQGLSEMGMLLSDYHLLLNEIEKNPSEANLKKLETIQRQIDAQHGWQFDQRIQSILTRLNLQADQPLQALSGGWQRRAALARALVIQPDLLLLDEPTNHLDVEAIQWLENQLLQEGVGLVFITHDRALLRRLATRILELDRGNLTSWPGDYENFLRRKEEQLHAETKQHADFDKKLAQEEVWIRQGIKARRTRNEGRVRALEAMRKEKAKRRTVQNKASFELNEGERSGQAVVEAKQISHDFQGRHIIKDFSTTIMRGDRIGLIGPNGVGKSTLLNILLGNLTPAYGTVKLGTNLQIAYFDQRREALDAEKTVLDNVAEGHQTVEIAGKQKHIISYLGDFLFTPQRALTPVKALSGGECNRLLLAKLFCKPANLLVLDEPTNDLDIETLELLEELLVQYQGTLLIVSHDRTFLDNVVTSTFVFEGNGRIEEFVGGYEDWLKQRTVSPAAVTHKTHGEKAIQSVKPSPKKLSYKDQKELEDLPQKIEQLEQEQVRLQQVVADPNFYKQNAAEVSRQLEQLKKNETALSQAYERWEQLEKQRNT